MSCESTSFDRFIEKYKWEILGGAALTSVVLINPALAGVAKASALKIKALASAGGHAVANGVMTIGHAAIVTTSLGCKALVIVGTGYQCYLLIEQISTDVIRIFRSLLGREPGQADYAGFIKRTLYNAVSTGLMCNGASWVCHLSHGAAAGLGVGAALICTFFMEPNPPHLPHPNYQIPIQVQTNMYQRPTFVNPAGVVLPGTVQMYYEERMLIRYGNEAPFIFTENPDWIMHDTAEEGEGSDEE